MLFYNLLGLDLMAPPGREIPSAGHDAELILLVFLSTVAPSSSVILVQPA